MTTIARTGVPCRVLGGVDTHKDVHVAAVIDDVGRILATASFPATGPGYRQLFVWLGRFVKEPSIFAVSRSKILKDLPSPIERLKVPGPSTIPTPELPNRPIGAGSVAGSNPTWQSN